MNASTATESGETEGRPEETSAIGAELRQRREALGYSTADVANELRILRSQIEAIEAGRFSELPETPFAIGFLRSYARFLELDADAIVLRFRSLHKTRKLRPPPRPQPSPEDGSRLSRFATLLAAVALVVLASVGWYYVSFDTPSVDGGPEAPALQPRLPAGAETSPPPPPRALSPADAPAAGAERDGRQAPDPPDATAAPGPADVPEGTDGTEERSGRPFGTPGGAAPDGGEASATPDAAAANGASAAARAATGDGNGPGPRIVLRASSDTYVLIRTPDDRPLFARLLGAGDSYEAPAGRTDLRLDTGNAGALEIVVGGRTLPPLGAAGAVMRDVSLDPRKLTERGG